MWMGVGGHVGRVVVLMVIDMAPALSTQVWLKGVGVVVMVVVMQWCHCQCVNMVERWWWDCSGMCTRGCGGVWMAFERTR